MVVVLVVSGDGDGDVCTQKNTALITVFAAVAVNDYFNARVGEYDAAWQRLRSRLG